MLMIPVRREDSVAEMKHNEIRTKLLALIDEAKIEELENLVTKDALDLMDGAEFRGEVEHRLAQLKKKRR